MSVLVKNQHVVLDVELNVYSVCFSRIHAGKFCQRNAKRKTVIDIDITVDVENGILSPAFMLHTFMH